MIVRESSIATLQPLNLGLQDEIENNVTLYISHATSTHKRIMGNSLAMVTGAINQHRDIEWIYVNRQFGSVYFLNGISTFIGYLMPNPSL